MENQPTFGHRPLAWAVLALLSACNVAPIAVATPTPLRAVNLGITQVGSGQMTRFVYCEESACPLPTKKTRVVQFAPVSFPGKDVAAPDSVDVTFPFNSPRMSEANKKLLTQAVAAHPGAHIEIIARSDFVGAPAAKRKLVVARANVMRSIVAKQAQGARITVRLEVAGPDRVAEAEQAQQRRGTVRFNLPIDIQLKGLPK